MLSETTEFLFVIKGVGFTIKDVISIIALIPAFFGGYIAIKNMKSTNKLKRVDFVSDILEKLYYTEDFSDIMYMFEYSKPWYNETFHGSEFEKQMDRYLSYLSYICYLKDMNTLSDKEFKILKYKINRIFSSYDLQCYLWNLYHFSKQRNMEFSFVYLLKYAKSNKLLVKDFYKNDCKKFMNYKYLNFES